ncbi:murein biosynthesis integral membrane protein MurJ [bacterium]|nr:murein biosynthesis integral membrane protein MurJ [bacterium]
MAQKELNPKKPKFNLVNIAGLLFIATFIGQLLGFIRTKLVNANFPTTGPQSTDAYFAAFAIPDFFFFTIAAGALGVAFMPVLSDRFYNHDKKAMWELSSSLLNFLAILMFFVAVIILLFAKPLISHIVAPGLSPEQLDVAANIMRLLALNPLLFTISGIFTSVQQTMGKFFFFAVAPLFYNMSIIASIYIFKDTVGLVGLGLGALIGAVLQLVIVMLGLRRTHFKWRPTIKWKNQDLKTVLRNLPARSLDQGVDQVESVVETHIASGLGPGNITYFTNAYILSTAPIMLIGAVISTAAFPRLNARLSQGRPDLFRSDFLKVLRIIIWISTPIVIFSYFSRGYLSRLIYTNGNQQISTIFGYLALAIFFRIIYSIISRWFYSQKDTKTPLIVSLIAISLNVFLAVTLAKPSNYGVSGLALAQSIVAATEVLILGSVMLYRDPKLFDLKFLGGVLKIFSVSGFTVVAAFIMLSLYPLNINDKGFITLGTKLSLIAFVVFMVHITLSSLFGLEEVRPVMNRGKVFFKKLVRN